MLKGSLVANDGCSVCILDVSEVSNTTICMFSERTSSWLGQIICTKSRAEGLACIVTGVDGGTGGARGGPVVWQVHALERNERRFLAAGTVARWPAWRGFPPLLLCRPASRYVHDVVIFTAELLVYS